MARTVAELTHLIAMARKLEDWDLVSALSEERRFAEVDADEAMIKKPVVKNQAEPFLVAVYMEDRSYGGPEEGGWYYTCGEIVDEIPVLTFTNAAAARVFAKTWNELAERDEDFNKGRPSISSVLSQGRYVARVYEGDVPAYYPESRPTYE